MIKSRVNCCNIFLAENIYNYGIICFVTGENMMSKKRAIIIVIDSMGCGAMPDHADFGDTDKCNTLRNVCEFNNGLDLPVMEALGLGNIQKFKGITRFILKFFEFCFTQLKLFDVPFFRFLFFILFIC